MPRFLVTRDPATGDRSAARLSSLRAQLPADTEDPRAALRELIAAFTVGKQFLILQAPTIADARAQMLQFRDGSHPRRLLLKWAADGYLDGTVDETWLSTGPDGVAYPDEG